MLDAALTLLYPGRRLHEQQVREALCTDITIVRGPPVQSEVRKKASSKFSGTSQEAAAYFEMARLVNLVPSCVLVYLGAWVSCYPT